MKTQLSDKAGSKLLFEKKYQLFLNFINHSSQADNAIEHMKERIPEVISNFKNVQLFKYLDVGCGYGYKTRSIINLIKDHTPLNTVALDPSQELLEIFQEQLSDDNINYIQSTWEGYTPKDVFDLITSIHTFYYIDNWESAITKMKSALKDNGAMCIVIRSNDQVCQFKDHFFSKIGSEQKKERKIEDLCDLLGEMGIVYEMTTVKSDLNIRGIFEDTQKGRRLIEFLLRTQYDDLNSDIKEEIRNYLAKHAIHGNLTHQDGFVWIKP